MPDSGHVDAMASRCAHAGLRITAPRRAVLAALHAAGPADAVALMREAMHHDASVRIGTVYRFLRELARLHLVSTHAQTRGRMHWRWRDRSDDDHADRQAA